MSYKIPNRRRSLMTNKLKEDFIKEYIKSFNHKTINDYEIIRTISYFSGTFPFIEAFKSSCLMNHLTGGTKLLKYYNSLDWYDSDKFDSEFCLIIIEYYIFNYCKVN